MSEHSEPLSSASRPGLDASKIQGHSSVAETCHSCPGTENSISAPPSAIPEAWWLATALRCKSSATTFWWPCSAARDRAVLQLKHVDPASGVPPSLEIGRIQAGQAVQQPCRRPASTSLQLAMGNPIFFPHPPAHTSAQQKAQQPAHTTTNTQKNITARQQAKNRTAPRQAKSTTTSTHHKKHNSTAKSKKQNGTATSKKQSNQHKHTKKHNSTAKSKATSTRHKKHHRLYNEQNESATP